MGQNTSREEVQLHGFCDEAFEPVKRRLQHMLNKGQENNVQLCVYVKGKCVIDLYGSVNGDPNYNEDTLTNIWSSGKSFEGVVMAMLYDKGLFKYEDKVAQHWPEFAQNGKEDVRICDILRHESGLPWFKGDPCKLEDFSTESIKQDKIIKFIEKEELHFPAGESKREYHALTRGVILNEIIRKIDPNKRTMAEIFRDEINIEGIILGMKDEELHKSTNVVELSTNFWFKEMVLPKWAGGRLDTMSGLDILNSMKAFSKMGKICKDAGMHELAAEIEEPGASFIQVANSPDWRKAEISSASFQGNARGCAKLASIMALKGQNLMSENAWREMHSEPTYAEFNPPFTTYKVRTNFTKGGIHDFTPPPRKAGEKCEGQSSLYKNRQGFFGWFGLGGSVVQWHPDLEIGFAFVPTSMHLLQIYNDRGAVLQNLVKSCCLKCNK